MTDNELYYRQRIREELEAAGSAADPAVSRIHLDMADQYRDMLSGKAAAKDFGDRPGPAFG